MSRSFSIFPLSRIRPLVRRVLALDAGSRRIKLLLAESDFGRLGNLREEMIDLQEEGLVSPEEIKAHLGAVLEDWGQPPLALVLPEHLSTSQIIDLPPASERDVEKLIHDESIKLSGVSESRIVYDFVRIETSTKNRQQFWVTLCQEGDIRERILSLGVEHEDLCEVTTTANALLAAYRAACPLSLRAVLVEMGAQTTVLVVLLEGQGAFATSFQMGGDFFTRGLARLRNCSEERAEALKRGGDILDGPDAIPGFDAVVDGWAAELKRQLNEWLEPNRGLTPDFASFEMVASGGGFEQPGLLAYLKRTARLNFTPWPTSRSHGTPAPAKGFEIAFGTALQALGLSAQRVSLLPEDYRAAWRRRLGRQKLELASLALVMLCALALALGAWHNLSLLSRKEGLLRKLDAAQKAVDANDALTADLISEYENLRPLFSGQQTTVDTLRTMALLQQTRSNRNLWYVLLADQQSYFNPPPGLFSTNRAARTNLLTATPAHSPLMGSGFFATLSPVTDGSPAKPGLIAELCVPEDAEAARRVRGQVVNDLKQQHLFSKVDLLSDDLRRTLADPKVVLPDRDFVLALDFAETDFQQSIRSRKSSAPGVRRGSARHNARPGLAAPNEAEKSAQITP